MNGRLGATDAPGDRRTGETVEGVILAAGRSSRTAPECKLLYRLDGQTVLRRSVGSLRRFCSHVFVVTGAHAEAVAAALRGQEGVALVHNPDFDLGMFGSVKTGLRQVQADAVFLLPGDCPFVTPEVFQALLRAEGSIAVPTFKGQDGHPVLLRRAAIEALLGDAACRSLRDFIAARETVRVPVVCPGVLVDIDTEEDFRQALRRAGDGRWAV